MPAGRQEQGAIPSTVCSLLIANLETRRVGGHRIVPTDLSRVLLFRDCESRDDHEGVIAAGRRIVRFVQPAAVEHAPTTRLPLLLVRTKLSSAGRPADPDLCLGAGAAAPSTDVG